jgi:SUKH-3 immunity protein
MQVFSPATLVLLRSAGWMPGRRSSTSEARATLEKAGFTLHPLAQRFLEEFGGLEVQHPHAKVRSVTDRFKLDVGGALKMFDPSWVREDYSRRAGAPLCVIGHSHRGYMVLAMAPDGQVYAGFDQALVRVGDSGEAAIENLCSGQDLEPLAD